MSEKETVFLKQPLVNVGQHEGGVYDAQRNVTTFVGKVKVDGQTAEDLNRRKEAWQEHQENLHRDNGVRDLESGNLG